jgi:hypothetical protein
MKRKTIYWLLILTSLIIISLSACERERTGCLDENATPRPTIELETIIQTPAPDTGETPLTVKVRGKMMEVDQLVDYPICNDNWSGTVYVSCDAQVADAELDADENPLFFKGCDLNIEPNTVVYVAAHNDAAYYKGCSCHTGENPVP